MLSWLPFFVVLIQLVITEAKSDPPFSQENYVPLGGTRCLPGTSSKIGETLTELGGCIAACDARADCYGVNWNPPQCIARTFGCALEIADGSTFYRKIAPPVAALVTAVPMMVTATTQPQTIGRNVLLSFSMVPGIRCAGGSSVRIGEIGSSLEICAALCFARSDCAGVNWQPRDVQCIARTIGCQEIRDESSVFYRPLSNHPSQTTTVLLPKIPSTTSTTTTTTTPRTTTTRTTAKPMTQYIQPAQNPVTSGRNVLANYLLVTGKRCSGGTSDRVGEITSDLSQCAMLCLARTDCAGFNWQTPQRTCIARTVGCIEMDDEFFVFYRKLSQPEQRQFQQTQQPAPEKVAGEPSYYATLPPVQPDTTDDGISWEVSIVSPNYMVAQGWDCVGGLTSQLLDPQKLTMQCAAICDRQSTSCYGFTVYPNRRICIARTKGCAPSPNNEGALLYRRKPDISTSGTTSGTTSRTAGTTSVPTPNLVSKELVPVILATVQTTSTSTTQKSTLALPQVTKGLSLLLFGLTSQKVTIPMVTSFSSANGDYTVKANTRCMGGTSVRLNEIMTAPWLCEAACSINPNCFGFNTNTVDGSCAMRTTGCIEEANTMYNLHIKKSATVIPAQTRVSVISTVKSTTEVRGGLPYSYDVQTDKRCLGGSSVALATAKGLDTCMNLCLQNSLCYGINIVDETNDCALRSAGCVLQSPALGMSFYRIIRG